jgi:pSer/pThr/pTyr-binding forkhead associated (FHA) protein
MPKNGGITLRIIDGADRGRVYEHLLPPITIGREEGNTIQLNDERVSRYHLKIQEDHERIVLTDLESTNGSRVNGEDVSLKILRFGDLITVGRSVILFGSREQIAGRLMNLKEQEPTTGQTIDPSSLERHMAAMDVEVDFNPQEVDFKGALHALQPPELPERLSAGQAAQLAEILEYLHIRLRDLVNGVSIDNDTKLATLDAQVWQNVVDLHAQVAEYLRNISNPR